jgi:hypothetical protein
MTPEEYNDLAMRTIDWYEDLNEQNIRDTSDRDISERLPPFLRFTPNNGYAYIDPTTGQISSLTTDQQSDLSSVIETERNNLRTRRNELRANSSGGKRKRRRTRRKSRKSRKSRRTKRRRRN